MISVHSDLSGRELIRGVDIGRPGKDFYEDVPRRLYIHFSKWSVIVGARTQGWSPWRGYRGFMGRHWWPIVICPGLENRCTYTGCGRAKYHRGRHA